MSIPEEAVSIMQRAIREEALSTDEEWISHHESISLAEAAARGLDAAGYAVVPVENLG